MEKKSNDKKEFIKGAKIVGVAIASVILEVVAGSAIGHVAGEIIDKINEEGK